MNVAIFRYEWVEASHDETDCFHFQVLSPVVTGAVATNLIDIL